MQVVISGSASLQEEIQKYIRYWNSQKDHTVLDYPKVIPRESFEASYVLAHKNFMNNITVTDILFIANAKKKGVNSYIGAETFAELAFGVTQKILYGKKLRIILAHYPSRSVACYDEIVLWLKLGWIDGVLKGK
ncbi:MAG: hypothetical protein A3B74_04685 [Candidatus Kerfeldbacteria bacterium RIFCSPHIGHO2_02_FULL_42_14]|uniref:Uncharacterized protein n=1 Tax=Candidatus Kerfeldbacteria bacterium RIFCSPHIGHO2_02_FULL_42_14 TaxID=1798540 RepID=A0A1G2ANZ6_9BACT|nr:MAG: hypothetical protein A3B74_04685 [Candidatus Kerfeldbacteria bacterium RIFCSPHIGHO2_02_FULL_42_14]OGY81021.1 MAG: hypothetical protein A3E60_03405 [Candidatus Kerfeldbacteria bacterium RIFCSPHIGHO2_12_FULL_42_13]OGY84945.1 MAG: hypothetical protein A3I91_00470 [Candidatus Kerfeldbacteria bacterium RIFCSPLOWO2_02_FULL_42_19]OGY85642.1 MAG: hypothetical protein A3G01_04690 [Candidatus Kerfeldbacteria bacterium RIFCSPLOWO2_12_FULL_43_9]